MLSLIIYGSRTLTFTKESGQFACPRCSMMREYNHRQLRLFFTLYFIPLIPMWRVGEYIECSSCGGTYGVEVLTLRMEDLAIANAPRGDLPRISLDDDDSPRGLPAPQPSSKEELIANVRRSIVLFMASLGKASPEVMQAFRSAFHELVYTELADQEVYQDYQQAKNAGATVANFVPARLGNQPPEVKNIVMTIATRIACADGILKMEGSQALEQLGQAMGMDEATMRSIIAKRGRA